MTTLLPTQRFALVARFFTILGLALWLGGMAFFGAVAAPALFRTARAHHVAELAPEIVGVMLGRFSFVTYVCGALLVVGWLLDGVLSRDWDWKWKAQGTGSVVALGLALYLGMVLLPQTIRQQDAILPIFARAERGEKLTPQEAQQRAAFDAGHRAYQSIASANVWLLMALLALVVARSGGAPTLATREASDATSEAAPLSESRV